MSSQLDAARINRDVQRLVEEVISHLVGTEGSKAARLYHSFQNK